MHNFFANSFVYKVWSNTENLVFDRSKSAIEQAGVNCIQSFQSQSSVKSKRIWTNERTNECWTKELESFYHIKVVISIIIGAMNNSQFLDRLGSDGQVVVQMYHKFKSNLEDFKSESNVKNTFTEEQWNKFDSRLQALESAVTDLKRTIDISNSPRFNRRH